MKRHAILDNDFLARGNEEEHYGLRRELMIVGVSQCDKMLVLGTLAPFAGDCLRDFVPFWRQLLQRGCR